MKFFFSFFSFFFFFFFFLEGNKNCRVGTKKTGSIGLAETQVFFFFFFFFFFFLL